jgi:hypothetical protein
MAEEMKVWLTVEEGNLLLMIAAAFGLPEKLGDQNFTVPDRAIAGDEARALYRILKAHSPMMLKKERWRLFGPADNYVEKVNANGEKYHETTDLSLEVKRF